MRSIGFETSLRSVKEANLVVHMNPTLTFMSVFFF